MAFTRVNRTAGMNDLVLSHLKRVGDISALEAQGMYKCRSLSRRICDLKEAGYAITSVHKVDNTGQRYVRYFLDDFHTRRAEAPHRTGLNRMLGASA